MKSTSLQAMIKINAERIADAHFSVAHYKDSVKFYAGYVAGYAEDKDSVSLFNYYQQQEYQCVDMLRYFKKKLAKAVELQKEMKAELAYIHREGRIDRMLDKLATVDGVSLVVPSNLTSYEMEAVVAAKIKEVFPPKADSRKLSA